MQSLIFFNKEGDNLNFRYNEDDERWEGDMIFHANSDDTFKTAGLYMFERIPSFEYEKPGDLYLQKFQLFNEYRFNITGNSFFRETVKKLELPNIDPTFYSKWVYGDDFESKFPIGTQVLFDKKYLEFTNVNQSYTVVKTKKNAIMLMSNLDNKTFNDKYGAIIDGTASLDGISISGVNSIGVYNYINDKYEDILSGWSEPTFYDKYYDGKVINVIGTEKNDGIYTVKNYLLNDKVYRRYELDARFLTQSYSLFMDITLKTELPTVYSGPLFIGGHTVSFGNDVPRILKPGAEFFFPSSVVNTNGVFVENVPKFEGIKKLTYFGTQSQVLYNNLIYQCKNAFVWTATSSILPDNKDYWDTPTYLNVKNNLEYENFESTEIQLTKNRFTYSQSFTQSLNVTLGSSVERFREDLRYFLLDYYFENKVLHLDLLYPSNYIDAKILLTLDGVNYENKTVLKNIYEQNVEIEQFLVPEIVENISENFSYNLVFTDIDEFGIRITVNDQVYYQEVEFIYDSLNVNMERTIDKTLRNWMTTWYLELSLTGIIPKLKFTGKEYSYYLNTIQLTTEYPNVPLRFNVEVGTTANYYLQRCQVILNTLGSYFSITINGRQYGQKTIISSGVIDFYQTTLNWVEDYGQILEGYGIIAVPVLSMIEFSVKEQDTRFEISVNTGASELPGNDSYIINDLFKGNIGAMITSNEAILSGPSYSFEDEQFATGQLVSINNSPRPWNNQEYNIEYLGPKDLILSYQGPFWGTTDPLCNITPFITIALNNGFGATGCTPAPSLSGNSGEFDLFHYSDAFSIRFGATNSYAVNRDFPINDEAKFVDIIYLSIVNKIYILGKILTVVNSITGKVETEIKLPDFSVGVSLTFNPFNNYLYCLSQTKLYMVDPLFPKLDYVIDLTNRGRGESCAVNPTNGDVYVSYFSDKFDIWFYNNYSSIPSITYPTSVSSLKYYTFVYNVSERDMYVSADDNILRFDGASRTLQQVINVPGLKRSLFYEPVNSSIYLFNSETILNLNGGEVNGINVPNISVSPWLNSPSGITASLSDVFFSSTASGYAVGVEGTILKTVSQGENWATQSSGTTNNLTSVHSTTYSYVIAVGEKNTFRFSIDGGQNWQIKLGPAVAATNLTSARMVNSSRAIITGDNNNIYFGNPNTSTWLAVPLGKTPRSMWTNTTSTKGYVVGDQGYIATFNPNTNATPTQQLVKTRLQTAHYKVSTTSTNLLMVGGESGALLYSDDSTNWYTTFSGLTSSTIFSINFAPNTNIGWLVGQGGMGRRTTNNGLTWTSLSTGVTTDLLGVHFFDSNNGVIVGDAGVILNTESATSFTRQTNLSNNNWTTVKLNAAYTADAKTKIVVGNGGTILKTDQTVYRRIRTVTQNGVFASASFGQTFTDIPQTSSTLNGSGARFTFTITPAGNLSNIQYTNRGINYTGSDVITVSGFNSLVPNDYIVLNVNTIINEYLVKTSNTLSDLFAVHFFGPFGMAVGAGGVVRISLTTGDSWINQNTPSGATLLLSVFVVSNSTAFVGGNGIWRTDNQGGAWTQQSLPGSTGQVTSISFKDPSNGVCCDTNGKYYTTSNGGTTWVSVEFNFSEVSFSDDNNGLIVGNNGIILRTTNGGTKWDYTFSGLSASFNSVYTPNSTTCYLVGDNGIIRKSEQSGINNSWFSQRKGTKKHSGIYMLDPNVGFVVGETGVVYKSELDPPFVRNLLFNNLKNEMVLSTTEGITVFSLEGNLIKFGQTPEYGPMALNQYDGDIYLASQNSQQLFVFDTINYVMKHSEVFFEGKLKELVYNPDRQSIFAIIPNDIIQVQSLVEVSVVVAAGLQQNKINFVEVGENNYGTLDPNYSKHPDLWLKTREYIRRPRENYNDEPYVQYIFRWEDDQVPEIFLYDFSGDQLVNGNIYDYIGPKPLNNISLNRNPNKKLDRIHLSEYQQTIFDELKFQIDHVDSETNFKTKPEPIEVFIGMNSQNEGVLSSKLNLIKKENIKLTIYANSTNNDVISFSIGVNDVDGLYGMIALDVNSNINFRQDDKGVSRGFKIGQLLKITIKDDTNPKNKYISLNNGITCKILKVFSKYLIVSFIDRIFKNEFTQIDDYPRLGSTTYLTVIFEIVEKTLATFTIRSQTEIEDIRYKIELGNSGHLIDPYDTFIFKTYDINEQGIDWNFLNKKRKEMLLVRDQIFPYIGSYKAIINSINFFGYNDLELYEYYRNIDVKSKDFYKLFKVEIPDIFDNSVPGWKENDFIKHTLPNPSFEETNLFNLTYRITDKEGTNVLLYSLAEVIMKLQGLKIWLEKKVIPITHRILDITGRADFVGVDTIQHRNYDTRIVNIKQNFTPIDFSLTEAYLMPINSGSTVYTCQVDFYLGFVPTYSVAPDYFSVRIRTYKTYKEWDPFYTYQLGEKVTYYDKIYENVIQNNRLKNPRKYESTSIWISTVDYSLGQYVEYQREIYQFIGTQSSFIIFGTVSPPNPFVDVQTRKSFSSWLNMTEWKIVDLVPVQNLVEYRYIDVSKIEEQTPPQFGELPKPTKASHSYNFTIDSNIDPFIVIEVTSDNGYGQTYTTKKTYEIRGTNDLSSNKTEGDPIGPFEPIVRHRTLYK